MCTRRAVADARDAEGRSCANSLRWPSNMSKRLVACALHTSAAATRRPVYEHDEVLQHAGENTSNSWGGTASADTNLTIHGENLYELAGLDHRSWTILGIDFFQHGPRPGGVYVYAVNTAESGIDGHEAMRAHLERTERCRSPQSCCTRSTPSASSRRCLRAITCSSVLGDGSALPLRSSTGRTTRRETRPMGCRHSR